MSTTNNMLAGTFNRNHAAELGAAFELGRSELLLMRLTGELGN